MTQMINTPTDRIRRLIALLEFGDPPATLPWDLPGKKATGPDEGLDTSIVEPEPESEPEEADSEPDVDIDGQPRNGRRRNGNNGGQGGNIDNIINQNGDLQAVQDMLRGLGIDIQLVETQKKCRQMQRAAWLLETDDELPWDTPDTGRRGGTNQGNDDSEPDIEIDGKRGHGQPQS